MKFNIEHMNSMRMYALSFFLKSHIKMIYCLICKNYTLFWVSGLYTYWEIWKKKDRLYSVWDTSRSNKGYAFSFWWKEKTVNNTQGSLGYSNRSSVTLWRVRSSKYFSVGLTYSAAEWLGWTSQMWNSLGSETILSQQQAQGEIIHAERRKKGSCQFYSFLPRFKCVFMFLMRRENRHVSVYVKTTEYI